MDSKKLISKTHTNLEEDRKRLTDLYEKVKELAENTSDILGLAAVSEHLVKITDSLTKQNAQLLDLAKMKQKEETASTGASPSTPSGLSEDDLDECFTEIEESKADQNGA